MLWLWDVCNNSCPNNAFTMNSGSVVFNVEDKSIDLPIICRQSDIKRARELTENLKKRIENGKFILNNCLD